MFSLSSSHNASLRLGVFNEMSLVADMKRNINLVVTEQRLAKLDAVHVVPEANWSRERTCLDGTREVLVNNLLEFATSTDRDLPPIGYLCDMAGVGKTTVSHTLANRLSEEELLGACFFFSRDDPKRSSLENVFTTLARQLANLLPAYRIALSKCLEKGIPHPENQLEELLLKPLTISMPAKRLSLVLLDALDECDKGPELLKKLQDAEATLRGHLRFVITTRPVSGLDVGLARYPEISRSLLGKASILRDSSDIQTYFDRKFLEIACQHGKEQPWPDSYTRMQIALNAGCLFIWASTACEFLLRSKTFYLDKNLRLLAELAGSGSNDLDPEKGLRNMYRFILSSAFESLEEPSLQCIFIEVLAFIIYGRRYQIGLKAIAVILDRNQEEVDMIIQSLRSVLTHNGEVMHPSFSRYMESSADPMFALALDAGHSPVITAALSRFFLRRACEENRAASPRDLNEVSAESGDKPRANLHAMTEGFSRLRERVIVDNGWSQERGCFIGTRRALIDEITTFAKSEDLNNPVIGYMCDTAWTGKTTVCHTVASLLAAEEVPVACFFFSKQDPHRNSLRHVFPTIACELARTFPAFRPRLLSALEGQIPIGPYNQFEKLIAEPLGHLNPSEFRHSVLIVLDALDGCHGGLELLQQLCSRRKPAGRQGFRVLLTARPTEGIYEGLCAIAPSKCFVSPCSAPLRELSDMQRYVDEKLSELVIKYGMNQGLVDQQTKDKFITNTGHVFGWLSTVFDLPSVSSNLEEDIMDLLSLDFRRIDQETFTSEFECGCNLPFSALHQLLRTRRRFLPKSFFARWLAGSPAPDIFFSSIPGDLGRDSSSRTLDLRRCEYELPTAHATKGETGPIYRSTVRCDDGQLMQVAVKLQCLPRDKKIAAHAVHLWSQTDHANIIPFLVEDKATSTVIGVFLSPWMANGTINDYLDTNRSSAVVSRLVSDMLRLECIC
ncbi:hypothetical protein OE88DRAFT_488684 [Heliocybe sulcata]|uniref:Nephrocystin 3-like N-terminal domain-containing protein n=1 Tax=Heliocybe sulcata TaxID=5364 RepID=A0A5C3MT58_9AGAM|nr:hypothetical protein OE88DRAFT_488684 [Heliocybe sulcata]